VAGPAAASEGERAAAAAAVDVAHINSHSKGTKVRQESSPSRRIRRPTPRCTLAMALVVPLVLAACGSSSSSSSSKSTTSATGTGSFAARRAQIQACLKKQGITPPARPQGGPPGGGAGAGTGLGGLFGGGPPGGRGNPKMRAALRKCGINFAGGRRRFFSTPAGKQALNSFVACVRKNGYNLPDPNTSGNGPVFDPTKVNRNDPKLIVAAAKCRYLLPRPRFGPGGGGPPPGAAQ